MKPYDRIIKVVFIVTHWLLGGEIPKNEQYSKFMSWSQLQKLKDNGWEIGSHTHKHTDLTTLDDDQLYLEMIMSRDMIKQFLNVTPTKVSYPYGKWNENVVNMATRFYKYGFGLKEIEPKGNYSIPRKLAITRL